MGKNATIQSESSVIFDRRGIDLSTIAIQNVGTSCIMLVSKFSRAIYAKHKIVIRLHHPYVLNTVCAYAKLVDDRELELIYLNIEKEVHAYLKSKYPEHEGNIDFRLNKKIALQSNERLKAVR